MSIETKMGELIGSLSQSSMMSDFCRIDYDLPGAERPGLDTSGWIPTTVGYVFTRDIDTVWVRFKITVPSDICGVVPGGPIRIMTNFQGPLKAYSNGVEIFYEKSWSDFRTPEIHVTEDAKPGDVYEIAFRYSAGKMPYSKSCFLADCFMPEIDEIRFNAHLFFAELKYLDVIDISGKTKADICLYLEPVIDRVLSREVPASVLPAELDKARAVAEPQRGEAKRYKVYLVGHAHIDMNWLWTMDETKDLIDRDFKTVCDIMDEFPEFKFSHSQAATYEICEQQNPALFERVKENIKSGRWDVTANAWVEHDANMASGEEICRQVMYAKSYLREKFGVNPEIMWAPDTFGHSANLPQIIKKCGIKNYFHMRCGKIVKSEEERLHGYHKCSDWPAALWQGMDGSEVLTANLIYNNEFAPESVLNNVLDAKEFGLFTSLFVYGIGDHGGAPTRRDVARALFASKSPMFPDVRLSGTTEYYDALRREISMLPDFPRRVGEMNHVFEGCYTTHADIKRAVRKLSGLLYSAEVYFSALNPQEYPYETLLAAWKTLLFHQFHDIFDGCAIYDTYQEAIPKLNAAYCSVKKLFECKEEPFTKRIFNPLPYSRDELIKLPQKAVRARDAAGNELAVQALSDGTFVRVNLPALQTAQINLEAGEAQASAGGIIDAGEKYIIENDYYVVGVLKSSGEFVNYYDKVSKRYLCLKGVESWRSDRGRLNTFTVYDEKADGVMSAWEIGAIKSSQVLRDGAAALIREDGELVKSILFTHRYKESVIRQEIVFNMHSPVITFNNHVTWNQAGSPEKGVPSLKVGFAPEINNSKVRSEIPFGTIEHPVKSAEVPQLRFSAVCDDIGGLALINDCKYGAHIAGNVLELSLIRGAFDPDPQSGIGEHEFSYSLYPFKGDISDSDILKYAAALNTDYIYTDGEVSLPFGLQLPGNIAISAIKAAEDRDGYILRAYESFGKSASLSIFCDGFQNKSCEIHECDVLENIEKRLDSAGKTITAVRFLPFEIKTIKIKLT